MSGTGSRLASRVARLEGEHGAAEDAADVSFLSEAELRLLSSMVDDGTGRMIPPSPTHGPALAMIADRIAQHRSGVGSAKVKEGEAL